MTERVDDTSFIEWARIYQKIGINARLVEINWDRLHRTTVSAKGLKQKESFKEVLRQNLINLNEYLDVYEGRMNQREVRACLSLIRQYAEAVLVVDRQIKQISAYSERQLTNAD